MYGHFSLCTFSNLQRCPLPNTQSLMHGAMPICICYFYVEYPELEIGKTLIKISAALPQVVASRWKLKYCTWENSKNAKPENNKIIQLPLKNCNLNPEFKSHPCHPLMIIWVVKNYKRKTNCHSVEVNGEKVHTIMIHSTLHIHIRF